MAPAGRYCVIDLSLNQHLSLWSNTVKRRPTHISKIMKSPNWSLSYLSFEETGLNGWQERGPPQEDLKKKKSVKDDFCLENVEVPQSNPLGRANTILLCCFCESPVLLRKRERERDGEGMSEGGVGWVEGWRWMGVVGLLGAVRVGRWWMNVFQGWDENSV